MPSASATKRTGGGRKVQEFPPHLSATLACAVPHRKLKNLFFLLDYRTTHDFVVCKHCCRKEIANYLVHSLTEEAQPASGNEGAGAQSSPRDDHQHEESQTMDLAPGDGSDISAEVPKSSSRV